MDFHSDHIHASYELVCGRLMNIKVIFNWRCFGGKRISTDISIRHVVAAEFFSVEINNSAVISN